MADPRSPNQPHEEPRGHTPDPRPHPAAARGHVEPETDLDIRGMHSAILRERSEPRDGDEPVPVWLIFVYLAIVGWIGVYLGLYSARFDSTEYDHMPAAGAAAGPGGAEQQEEIDPVALGERLYANCIACHQSDGGGVAGTYPPLDGSGWLTEDPETPVRILLRGLDGPIEVAGETYSGEMPTFGGRFTDERIAAVLTYVRQAWGNDAPPVDPALVTAIRQQHSGRAESWSADELRDLRSRPVPGYEPDAGDERQPESEGEGREPASESSGDDQSEPDTQQQGGGP